MSETFGEAIPNQYIVVFKQHASDDARQQHLQWAQATHSEAAALRAQSGEPELTGVGEKFNIDTFSGYVGSFDESLKNEIQSRGEVEYVEPDSLAYGSYKVTQRPVPSWGLARMSSKTKLPDPLPNDLAYEYDSSAGEGTWGYVIDSGILTTHVDFGGRAKWGANFIAGSPNADEHGHGTHVAGIVGGRHYGMAKRCQLIAVKVLDASNSGPWSSIIQGIEWAVNDARNNGRLKRSVVNMSIWGGYNQACNNAAAAAVRAGLTMVVIAGNNNLDAGDYSPASEPLAYTIGSIDRTDIKSNYSNFGKSVDLFAPGRDITSAWNQPSNTGTNTISGTSMACPHVVGLALCLIGQHPAAYPNPEAVTRAITALATRNSRVVPPVPAGTTTLISWNGL